MIILNITQLYPPFVTGSTIINKNNNNENLTSQQHKILNRPNSMSAEVAWISCCFVKKAKLRSLSFQIQFTISTFFMSFAIRLSGRKAANKLID